MGFYRQRNYGSFDPSQPLVAGRQMTLDGAELNGGDPIPAETDEGIRRRLWMVEHAHYAEDYTPTPEETVHPPETAWMDHADGVAVTAGENGWYEVKADWAEEAEKVRGAEAAQARAEELRAAGDDKGVTVAHTGGGWYEVKAPWAEEAEKIQGKEAAEARAVELRGEAPPPDGTGQADETPPGGGEGDQGGGSDANEE